MLRPDGIFITVQNWDTPTNQNWVTRLASLTNFAGQTVTLYFEQNDGGQGNGEYRFVDNIQVLTTGPAVYPAAAPRLLAASASLTNGVGIEWRDNDSNELQFLIERKVLPGGAWSQIAIVASNLTSYTDWMPPPGTNVAYRLRASNAAGPGSYSNERQVLTWPRPKLAGQFSSSVATLNWPAWASNFALHAATQLQATVWTRVTNNPTNSPAGLTVTLPLESGTGQSFFRLQLF